MKKYFLLLVSLASLSTGFSQTIRASVGAGSASNRIKIYMKSDVALAPANISTLQFDLAIPEVTDPKPTITILSNAFGATWSAETATEGGFYHYFIQTPTSPLSPTFTTDEFEAMEVEFSNNFMADMSGLVTLADGGSSGKALFLCTGSNINSDGGSLYYPRTGTIVTNVFSYDIGGGTPGVGTSLAVFNTLPVKFLSFYALKNGDDAKLSWTVGSDEENKYFDIERSLDGRSYTAVAKVNALGNGKSTNTYTASDLSLSKLGSRVIYYRIKQIDKTGGVVYSAIRTFNLSQKSSPVSVYPNPARSITKLVLDAPEAGKGSIVVRDAAGKQVQVLNVQFVKGINQQDINVNSLAAGEYNLTVIGKNLNETIKFSKTN